MNINRRNFLQAASVFFAGAAIAPGQLLTPASGGRALHMLMLGDSIVWGQGLLTENKFWYITREWLRKYLDADVKEHIEAHSGATIQLRNAGKYPLDRTQTYNQEINISSPTISLQAKHARAFYETNVRPENVGLILVDGGINDVSAFNVVNPVMSDSKLKKHIRKYCGDDMSGLLAELRDTFPNARIVVTGYYRLITKDTPETLLCELIDSVFRQKYDGPFKFLLSKFIQDDLCKSDLVAKAHLEMIRQSKIWHEDSTEHLRASVKATNEKKPFPLDGDRVIFVPAPFESENAYGNPKSFLWKVREKTPEELKEEELKELELPAKDRRKVLNFTTQDPAAEPTFANADPLYEARRSICRCSHIHLESETSYGVCTVAATGHPNTRGARAYANVIRAELEKIPKAQWHIAG